MFVRNARQSVVGRKLHSYQKDSLPARIVIDPNSGGSPSLVINLSSCKMVYAVSPFSCCHVFSLCVFPTADAVMCIVFTSYLEQDLRFSMFCSGSPSRLSSCMLQVMLGVFWYNGMDNRHHGGHNEYDNVDKTVSCPRVSARFA